MLHTKKIFYLLVVMLVVSSCKKEPSNTFSLLGTWKSYAKINATYNQQTLTETIDSVRDWTNVITLQIGQYGSDTAATVGATKYSYPDLCIIDNSQNNTGSGPVHYESISKWYYFWNGTYSVFTSNDTLGLQCGYGGGGGYPISRVRVFFKKS